MAIQAMLFALGCVVCCGLTRAESETANIREQVATYEVKGIIKEVLAEKRKAVIAHDAIPGFMDAMTMEFSVNDARELSGLRNGDAIAFRLSVAAAHGWIDHVRKIDAVPAPAISIAQLATRALPELKPGDAVPDCTLRNHRGEVIRLSQFKGQALVFTFIFTRCPFPDFCPLMNSHLRDVQITLLKAAPAINWQLLSISIDPVFDTPERLADYAKRYEPDPAHWSFATGEAAEIQKLAGAFGLTVFGEGAAIQHNLRTVVIDAAGRVQRVFIGNDWTAREVVEEMEAAMRTAPQSTTPMPSAAPPLRPSVRAGGG